MFWQYADFFSKSTFSNNSFRNTTRVPNSLENVWTELVQTFCKDYQQIRVNVLFINENDGENVYKSLIESYFSYKFQQVVS